MTKVDSQVKGNFAAVALPFTKRRLRGGTHHMFPHRLNHIKEALNKPGRAAMRIKIVECEARNAVNIGNISKFRNEAVGDFELMDAGHDLFRFLNIVTAFFS